ncbi:MAG: dihydroorotate dehydrogenase [Lachnospiraceae bacterium]|nr:dihydroorotate dehydrogenase [Lachnospiraceae bacterium]
MTDMRVNIAGAEFKNPVTVASGTFGSGMEYSDFLDLSKLGAVTTKGVAIVPWSGNDTPRVAEVRSGMLNAIGLQNPGLDTFLERDLPFLKGFDTGIIVNVCGHSEEEYIKAVERLSDADVDLLEINISCPNVKEGGISFGTVPKAVEDITAKIKKVSAHPVIMKLSPNVTSIAEIAKAAEAGGADALSLINTITGMKIDIERQDFILKNKTGGMSGPAVHPVAVRMVYEVREAVDLPIIGMGGIETPEDAVEMMLAGADMVAVGTANFYKPDATLKIIDGIKEYCERKNIDKAQNLKEILHAKV